MVVVVVVLPLLLLLLPPRVTMTGVRRGLAPQPQQESPLLGAGGALDPDPGPSRVNVQFFLRVK